MFAAWHECRDFFILATQSYYMKLNTFWLIVIKCFGLWLLYNALISLPQIFATFLSMQRFSAEEPLNLIIIFINIASTIVTPWLLIFLLLFKSKRIAEVLKLNHGINQETIDITVNSEPLFRVVVIILGWLTIIRSAPIVIKGIIAIMDNNPYLTADFLKQQKQEAIINICFIVMGYLLINFNAKAAQYINITMRSS